MAFITVAFKVGPFTGNFFTIGHSNSEAVLKCRDWVGRDLRGRPYEQVYEIIPFPGLVNCLGTEDTFDGSPYVDAD